MEKKMFREIQRTSAKKLAAVIRKVGYGLIFLGGFFLLVVGFLGIILPVLPGWIFVIMGLLILGERTSISRFILRKLPPQIRDRVKK